MPQYLLLVAPDSLLILAANPAVGRLLGADESAMKSLREGHFPHTVFCDPTAWQELVMRASALGETLSADLEVRRFDGSARWVHCLVSVQAEQRPEDRGLVEGVLYDVTQRRRAESQALHRAEHDALTGLKNYTQPRRGRAGAAAAPGPGQRPQRGPAVRRPGWLQGRQRRVRTRCGRRRAGLVGATPARAVASQQRHRRTAGRRRAGAGARRGRGAPVRHAAG